MEPLGPQATHVTIVPHEELVNQNFTDMTNASNVTEITWDGLRNVYASSHEDLQELFDLLDSWHLPELYNFFVGK